MSAARARAAEAQHRASAARTTVTLRRRVHLVLAERYRIAALEETRLGWRRKATR